MTLRLVTFETSDQSDQETWWPDQQKDKDREKDKDKHNDKGKDKYKYNDIDNVY